MMRVKWNYYDTKGKAEGITQLNHVIVGYGDKEDMKQLIEEQKIPRNSQSYSYEVKECITKKGKLCLHVKWNGFWD